MDRTFLLIFYLKNR